MRISDPSFHSAASDPAAEVATSLRDTLFLQDETEAVRRELAELAACRNYPKGSILFFHGDHGDTVYIVLQGRVKISLTNEDGREVGLAVMRPGGVFGLVEALDNGPHSGTAVALMDCRLARITSDRFAAWLRRHPALQERLLIGLVRMLREAYEKVGEQALLSVKRRLFTTLLEIARSDGEQQGKEVFFELPTHQELADRIGSSRVVVSRVLKELIEEERGLTATGRVIRLPLSALVTRDGFEV
jgi:CRP/FNR family transcriptional regulator, cyclic AMP receptor protein